MADQGDVIQIALRIEDSLPVGVATGPDGTARAFVGWVGLMAAVDALVTGEEDTLTAEDLQ